MRKIFLGLLMAGLGSLSLFASLEDDLKLSLEVRQVEDLTPEGLNYVFYINIDNVSSKTYRLSGYSYRFLVEGMEYLRLQRPLDGSLGVSPSGKTMIALPVKITYALLFQEIGEELSERMKVKCAVMGELAFAERRRERGRLPFAFSGEFPIFKAPQFSSLALKAAAVTIGGADLSFEAKVKNPNMFDLQIDRLNYTLYFGGHKVDEGTTGSGKNIGAKVEEAFVFPLLLDFFEMGRDLYAILTQSTVNCRISGTLEIRIPWTRLVFPFDTTESVPVLRQD